MKLVLTPLNPTVGAIDRNTELAAGAIDAARASGADLVVLPELVICGYPPRDLLFQEGFVEMGERAVASLAERTHGLTAILGAPWRIGGDQLANCLLALRDGRIIERYEKRLLPTYDVFDEDRYFRPGDRAAVIEVAGRRVGLTICEDLWRGFDMMVEPRYRGRPDPVAELLEAGVDLIVNPSGSPFTLAKADRQSRVLAEHVSRFGVPFAAVNQCGANDSLIFDGKAQVVGPGADGDAEILARNEPFSGEALEIDLSQPASAPAPACGLDESERLFRALRLGVRDYLAKTGFDNGAVLGLSGGIDSSVVACLAAAALGPERTLCVGMPSRYSSEHSVSDARELADALGCAFIEAPIKDPHDAMEGLLAPHFEALAPSSGFGLAEENVQSRLRGLTLMALSNKLGKLVLATGNKSEMAVGYCTLYGDMNGALAVIADLTKGQVYALARWMNEHPGRCGFARAPIPRRVHSKPPSAELRPDQTDQDTLPPYEQLDEVVRRRVERREGAERIARETGMDPALVSRLLRMIAGAEHKRRQAPIILKVSDVAFGIGRRFPVAQSWSDAAVTPDNREAAQRGGSREDARAMVRNR